MLGGTPVRLRAQRRLSGRRLPDGIPRLHINRCRVAPSPPAIRDMKEPRRRKVRRGFDFKLSVKQARQSPGTKCRGFDVARPHPLRAQDEAWNGLKT
jgi:hypothetical protein